MCHSRQSLVFGFIALIYIIASINLCILLTHEAVLMPELCHCSECVLAWGQDIDTIHTVHASLHGVSGGTVCWSNMQESKEIHVTPAHVA